jgi:hypothetical protein
MTLPLPLFGVAVQQAHASLLAQPLPSLLALLQRLELRVAVQGRLD